MTFVLTVVSKPFLQLATESWVRVDRFLLSSASHGPGGGVHVRDLALHAVSSAIAFLHVKADHGLAGFLVKQFSIGAYDAITAAEAVPDRPSGWQEEAEENDRRSVAEGGGLESLW